MEEVVSVAVGENVPYIGVRAFEGCTELSQLNLGGVQEISYGAFDGCTSLTSIAGGRITTIGAYAFQDCDSLASFPLGEAVTTIGTCAFQNCSALGPDLLLPSAVSKIGQSAYEGCTSLLQIEVPDADSIGDSAFAGCTNLTFVQINCLNVGNRALAECTALEGAAFGGKTLTLGTELFDGCTALTEVTYENEGTTLSEGAFQGCTSLAAPSLPAGTTEIPAENVCRLYQSCRHRPHRPNPLHRRQCIRRLYRAHTSTHLQQYRRPRRGHLLRLYQLVRIHAADRYLRNPCISFQWLYRSEKRYGS